MKLLALAPLSFLAMAACAIASDETAPDRSSMACDVGPISKTYGETKWLVYSCKDARSVVMVTAPGNPATPFYFMLLPQSGGIRLYGEGTGDKSATKAAFNELESLTELDVAQLVVETQEHVATAR